MKTKVKTTGILLAITLIGGSSQYSCQSKVKEATKNVQNEYRDVVEAKKEGEKPEEIQEERQELNKARKDYVDTWEKERNTIKQEINEGIQRIDTTITRLEQRMQQANGGAKETYRKAIAELRTERMQLESRGKDVIAATQANWSNTKRQIRNDLDASKDRVNRLVADTR